MDATTERLVDYTMGVRYEDLPAKKVTAVKQRVLDTLGCVAGAYDHPVSVSARCLAQRYSMDTAATILGGPGGVAPEMAAFANSTMLRLLDLSDTYRVQSGGHPSDILGAIFAAAELGDGDGKSLITAVAVGYEIYCSCCDAADLNGKGWDQPVYGVVASALAAGKLMGLDRDQIGHAVAMAITPNLATLQTRSGELSNWKGCAGANAARNGLFAAILAQEGFSGPDQPIEGKFGLWDMVAKFEWPLEVGQPPYRIANSHVKCFPVCYHGQTAVWAALEMRDRFDLDDIEEVKIDTYAVAKGMMADAPSRWAPQTPETADHSLPYVVSLALRDGGIGLDAYDDEKLFDPGLADLMQRISVDASEDLTAAYPRTSPSRITVRLKDGSETQNALTYPKGHNQAPLSDAEIASKFRGLFSAYRDEARADAMISLISDLDNVPDVTTIFEAFA